MNTWKRWVFRWLQKTGRDGTDVTWRGTAFWVWTTAIGEAQSPKVVSHSLFIVLFSTVFITHMIFTVWIILIVPFTNNFTYLPSYSHTDLLLWSPQLYICVSVLGGSAVMNRWRLVPSSWSRKWARGRPIRSVGHYVWRKLASLSAIPPLTTSSPANLSVMYVFTSRNNLTTVTLPRCWNTVP